MTPAAYKRVEMMCSNLKRTKGSRQEVYNRNVEEIKSGAWGLLDSADDISDAHVMLNAYCWSELGFRWDAMDYVIGRSKSTGFGGY